MGPLLSSFWTTLMISGEYIKIFHLFLYVKYNNSQYFLKRSHIHIHVFMLETPLQCYLLLLLLLLLMLLLLLSHFSRVQLCATPQPTRLPRPWDSPGKNTGVGCHFLLQCRKVKSESEIAQSYRTLRDPMNCSLPGSPVHGIFQARVLEWGAIAFSVYSLIGY